MPFEVPLFLAGLLLGAGGLFSFDLDAAERGGRLLWHPRDLLRNRATSSVPYAVFLSVVLALATAAVRRDLAAPAALAFACGGAFLGVSWTMLYLGLRRHLPTPGAARVGVLLALLVLWATARQPGLPHSYKARHDDAARGRTPPFAVLFLRGCDPVATAWEVFSWRNDGGAARRALPPAALAHAGYFLVGLGLFLGRRRATETDAEE